MQELCTLNGMVLRSEPIGEYDRRVVLLSVERGKISCFARGARRLGSRFMASTNPFSFGEFRLYEGRNSYSLSEAVISEYFRELRTDYEGALYGMYFLELADYYSVENNDERELLKLLYQSVRALLSPKLDNRLVRCVYELRALTLSGEYPGLPARPGNEPYDPSTEYAAEYAVSTEIRRLYSFQVSSKVLAELSEACRNLQHRFIDRRLKSLELLESEIESKQFD